MLEQLDRAVADTRAEPPCRTREALPQAVVGQALEQQYLAARPLDRNARRHDARVVHDRERIPEHVRHVCEPPMIHSLGHAIVDQQARLVAARHGMLRDELRREVVLELPRFHPAPTVPLWPMDDGAMDRAQERVEQRADGAALDALLVRAREQVEALAAATSALEDSLPARVEDAVRGQAEPVGRGLAEVRGLTNQLLRRLSAIEGDLLTERNARVDDLALLVDLVSSGWKGVDARLGRIEAVVNRLEQLQDSRGAIVYRMEDRRPDAASAPTSTSSPRRFASARKSASSAVQSSSHGEMRTSTAAAPAAARTTKSPPIVITSSSTTCLSASV